VRGGGEEWGREEREEKVKRKKVHPESKKYWAHGEQPSRSARGKKKSQKTCTERPTPMRKQQYHVKLEHSSGLAKSGSGLKNEKNLH